MADASLERDELFQLNTPIWASLPQPPQAPIRPVLYEAGFEFWSMEQRLPASITETAAFRSLPFEVQPNPVVDVVLGHRELKLFALIEQKPDSFGTRSQRAPQARGLIAASGNIARRIPVDRTSSGELCYVVPAASAVAMDETLDSLASEMRRHGLATGPTGALGIRVADDGIYLGCDAPGHGAAKSAGALVPPRRVLETRPDEELRVFYIVPWMPHSKQPTASQELKAKLRALLLAWVGRAPTGGETTLSFGTLLRDATYGIFERWDDDQSLKGEVFPAVANIVRALTAGDRRIRIRPREIALTLQTKRDRQLLQQRIRTSAVPESLPSEFQFELPLPEEESGS